MTWAINLEMLNNGGIAALGHSFFSEDIPQCTDLSASDPYCWSMEAIENSGVSVKSYRDLMVWQISIDLVTDIYKLTQFFPPEERYGLVNQMRRSAVSIPCNIAEGKARRSSAGLLYFVKIAQGSIAELQTQIEIAQRLQYTEHSQIKSIWQKTESISKMLFVLSRKIETHQKTKKND
ncbi:MAG: four helix bundle protein [Flavobacteriales bacterium]